MREWGGFKGMNGKLLYLCGREGSHGVGKGMEGDSCVFSSPILFPGGYDVLPFYLYHSM